MKPSRDRLQFVGVAMTVYVVMHFLVGLVFGINVSPADVFSSAASLGVLFYVGFPWIDNLAKRPPRD